MTIIAFARWTAAVAMMLALGACGGGGDSGDGAGPPPGGVVIGAAGGTVTGPGGSKIVIPAGALTTDTRINIEQTTSGAPALPVGVTPVGAMFALTPHGTTFNVPVTVTLPFDAASVPAGMAPAFFKTNAQNGWEQIGTVTFNADTLVAQIASFSNAQAVFKSLALLTTDWEWEFQVLEGARESFVTIPGAEGAGSQSSTEGLLDRFLQNFGAAFFDRPVRTSHSITGGEVQQADREASGLVQATQDGVTFGVFTEAPYEAPNGQQRLGSTTRLVQKQSFKKKAANASLTFTVTNIEIETTDFNNRDGNNADLPEPQRTALAISGEVSLAIHAYTASKGTLYDAKATAYVTGNGTLWHARAFNEIGTRDKLWNNGNFTVTQTPIEFPLSGIFTCLGTGVALKLNAARSFTVDVSAADGDETIFVEVTAEAKAQNRRGARSDTNFCGIASASAFLKDPQQISGTTMTFAGLEPTNERMPAPQRPVLVAPVGCPAPTPDAGVLQFEAANFVIGEFAGAVPTVAVTRTGGSRGEVSATITTSDRTAIAGTDYQPLSATVFFADGDTEPRLVRVTPIQNDAGAADKTVNLALSQPGGCATLGAQATTVLTIRDDVGTVPPPTTFSIGGTVNGLAGSGLVLEDTGREVAIAGNGTFAFPQRIFSGTPYLVRVKTQPVNPNQVCVVTRGAGVVANADVTNIAVDCATPPPVGSLDGSFGSGGKVFVAGFSLSDTSSALALQPDGKLLAVGSRGGSNGRSDFAVVRLNVDGSLDPAFGSGGVATADFAAGNDDKARAVSVQADGKIVVAGFSGPNFGSLVHDFAVARFNADGSLDTTFGTGGRVTTDFNGSLDEAQALVIQSDGRIVVAGEALTSTSPLGVTEVDFALARYNTDGSLDASFGNGGKVTTQVAGGVDFGRAVALQADGRIVVAGGVGLGTSRAVDMTGLARYNTDGSLDTSFGTNGTITHNLLGAHDLLILGDGRMLVTGSRGINLTSLFDFAIMRLNPDGRLDGSFAGGIVTTDFGATDDNAFAVALQADGRFVVAGNRSDASVSTLIGSDFALARYRADGALDATFGSGGKLGIDLFGASETAVAMVIQPDGRIVAAGATTSGTSGGLGLVRVLP